jgi:hypothetical protein
MTAAASNRDGGNSLVCERVLALDDVRELRPDWMFN